jgi:BirA family transcriptional regulator, biotin operon repressor / biotin---[acetyl-CoA-carboxylase] ligase
MFAGMGDGTPVLGERWDVRYVGETGSTNADLLDLARQGAPEGVVLVADHQTAGRGRMGRVWEAPAGASLLCSILLRPAPQVPVHRATQAVAVAAARACQRLFGFAPDLKWPNDLFVGDRKLAGILAEGLAGTVGGQPAITAVAVGIGMNCTWPDPMPGELAGRGISLNHLVGRPVDRDEVLAAMLDELAVLWSADTPSHVLVAEYRKRLGTLGQHVQVHLSTGAADFTGTATDLTDAGELVIAPDDGGPDRVVSAGDVERMRPTG